MKTTSPIFQCLAIILICFSVNNSLAEYIYKPPMRTEWKVGKGDVITLPLREGFNYNFSVNWGDETPQQFVTSYDDSDKAHRYDEAGIYEITLSGTLEAWSFIRGDLEAPIRQAPKIAGQLLKVLDLGDMGWKDLSFAFAQCSGLTEVSGGNLSEVTDISYMFYSTSQVNPDTRYWNVSSVEYMIGTFEMAHGANPDVSLWPVYSLINSRGMFKYTTIAKPDMRNWKSAYWINRSEMFCHAKGMINLRSLQALAKIWSLSQDELKDVTCLSLSKSVFEDFASQPSWMK